MIRTVFKVPCTFHRHQTIDQNRVNTISFNFHVLSSLIPRYIQLCRMKRTKHRTRTIWQIPTFQGGRSGCGPRCLCIFVPVCLPFGHDTRRPKIPFRKLRRTAQRPFTPETRLGGREKRMARYLEDFDEETHGQIRKKGNK